MLKHLYIQNYALISELSIDFERGFSVLTGETGAGKSIILGALGLIKGERADSKNITEGEKKAVVEAVFEIEKERFENFFSENNLDFDTICIIRRELTDNGKSRAFVNDTPVGLGVLRMLSEALIDIHSQHENALLHNDMFQLGVVDAVAENTVEKETYSIAYEQYRNIEQQLNKTEQLAAKSREDADYIAFQHQQLTEAVLKEDEENELEQELQLLEHAEQIKSVLSNVAALLNADSTGAVSMIKEAISNLRHVSKYLPAELSERLNSTYIELRDIADEAEKIENNTDFNPERLSFVEQRFDLLNSLMQKHRCQSVKELIDLRNNLAAQLEQNENFDEQIAALKQKLKKQKEILIKAAECLTDTRKAATKPISEQLVRQLSRLGIEHAKIEVSITPTTDFTESGSDFVQFMFAANLNQQPRPVHEIASGGEMARIMLTIKALTAAQKGLPTIIFDEVDTGVSGEVADNMGMLMQQMATSRQVIAITHLPQIASKGIAHYKVYKEDTATRTETRIRYLHNNERIQEIATLLSGENITDAAINNAKELLNRASY